jgi:hypothetical protein
MTGPFGGDAPENAHEKRNKRHLWRIPYPSAREGPLHCLLKKVFVAPAVRGFPPDANDAVYRDLLQAFGILVAERLHRRDYFSLGGSFHELDPGGRFLIHQIP